MRVKQINTALYNLLGEELIDWERDELALKLSLLSPDVLKEVMRHLPVIWPVSYMLFYAFIEQASTAGSCLKPEQFHNWVKAVLDVYEADGLRQAQLFMEEVESKYVCQIRGEAGASLLANEHLLASLARGMLGRDIKIIASPETSFDTEIFSCRPFLISVPGKDTIFFSTSLPPPSWPPWNWEEHSHRIVVVPLNTTIPTTLMIFMPSLQHLPTTAWRRIFSICARQ